MPWELMCASVLRRVWRARGWDAAHGGPRRGGAVGCRSYTRPVAVTRIAYEAEGWGVGELWLEDDVVVWHELPGPAATVPETAAHPLAKRLQRYFAGRPETFDDVAVD